MKHATQSQKRLGFRIHAMVFVPAVALQLAINSLTGRPYWSLWVLLGWSVGLFSHWFFVLGPGSRRTGAA
jgi:2TM domain-containing protein